MASSIDIACSAAAAATPPGRLPRRLDEKLPALSPSLSLPLLSKRRWRPVAGLGSACRRFWPDRLPALPSLLVWLALPVAAAPAVPPLLLLPLLAPAWRGSKTSSCATLSFMSSWLYGMYRCFAAAGR